MPFRRTITDSDGPPASSGIAASIGASVVLHLAFLGTFAAVGGFNSGRPTDAAVDATWQETPGLPPMNLVSEPVMAAVGSSLIGVDDLQTPILELPAVAPPGPGGGRGDNLPGRSSDAASAKGAAGQGTSGSGAGVGDGSGDGRGRSGFFGRGMTGERVVYVVDSSRSMNQPHPGPGKTRLGRVKIELINSIRALQPDQKFFIVFFNERPIAMPADRMMEANDGAKLQYLRWMVSIPGDGDTDPALALLLALKLNPDTIYFLTDGDFRPTIVRDVAISNRSGVKIHTIGFTQDRGEKLLRTIATQSGGTYTYVPPDETSGGAVADSKAPDPVAKP